MFKFKRHPRCWYTVAGVVLVAMAVGATLYEHTAQNTKLAQITPSGDFQDYTPPKAPDYSQDTSWIALPDQPGPAHRSPQGLDLDRQATADVDVFYVHPTTFESKKDWNQPRDDADANAALTSWALPGQASVFNGCCKIYAPWYRQATLAAFFDHDANTRAALNLAYGDIVRAFENYMETRNDGRAFFIAGHSQGSHHIKRMIAEVLTEDMIANQLIAAYIVGQPVPASDKIPTCETSTQTGCQISWNTQTAEAEVSIGVPGGICVNPIIWTADDDHAPRSTNLGSVDFGANGPLEMDVVDAQCRNGLLIISGVDSANFKDLPFGAGNYHTYDYGLFHMDLRKNVADRTAAYFSK